MLTGPRALALVAHAGQPPAPHDLWGAWDADPLVAVALLLAAWLHARGRSRRVAGRAAGAQAWRGRAFAGGLATVALALLSPLDALAQALASAHMVQHVLLVLVAAPLLALAAPGARLLRGSPPPVRHAAARWLRRLRPVRALLRQPAPVWLAHAGVLWLWHASVPYTLALERPAVHAIEHATFLGSALLLWRLLLAPNRALRLSPGLGVLVVFATSMQGVFLSLLLTFARTPWYEAYATTAPAWGLDALADQQLAGAVMWVPGGFIHLAAALALLAAWVRGSERAHGESAGGGRPAPAPAGTGAGAGGGRGQ